MTNNDLETRLHQAYQGADVEVRSSSMSETILLARKEAYYRRQRLSFPQFLSMQIRFIGWKVWAVQAAYLLTVCGLLSHLLGQGYWKDPQSVAGLLVCLSLFTFMAAPPFLYRSIRYRMQEVEAVFFRSAAYGKAHHHRNRRWCVARRYSVDSSGKNCITAKQCGGFGCFSFSAGKQRMSLSVGACLPPAVSCWKYGAVRLSAYGAFSGTPAFPPFFPPISGLDWGMHPADCFLLSSVSLSSPQLRLRRNASNLKGYTLWIYAWNIFQNASKT